MMNSDKENSYKKIENILFLLTEERISHEIDESIDQVSRSFQYKVTTPCSHLDFNRVIAELIQLLYQKGLRQPHYITHRDALTEAIFLLNRHYRGVHTSRYDGALLDAVSGDLEGFELVLDQLVDSVKEAERNKYIEWVFVSNIDPLDWETKHLMVSAYLKQYGNFLPPQLSDMDPSRLADHINDLISNHLAVDSPISDVFWKQ